VACPSGGGAKPTESVQLCPTAIEAHVPAGGAWKSPLVVMELMFSVPVPSFFTASDWLAGLPSRTLPNDRLLLLSVAFGCPIPYPITLTTSEPFSLSRPLYVPAMYGEKTTSIMHQSLG